MCVWVQMPAKVRRGHSGAEVIGGYELPSVNAGNVTLVPCKNSVHS